MQRSDCVGDCACVDWPVCLFVGMQRCEIVCMDGPLWLQECKGQEAGHPTLLPSQVFFETTRSTNAQDCHSGWKRVPLGPGAYVSTRQTLCVVFVVRAEDVPLRCDRWLSPLVCLCFVGILRAWHVCAAWSQVSRTMAPWSSGGCDAGSCTRACVDGLERLL